MEKVSWICLGILSLVKVALSFAFVKIDVRSIVLEFLDQKCVGSKELLSLDQVLKSTWSYLTTFGTATSCQGRSTT
jgi:hypothetical protein